MSPVLNYTEPPKTGNAAFDEYMLEAHQQIWGLGSAQGVLDDSNIAGGSLTSINHANISGVASYQHHGTGAHDDLERATDPTDVSVSGVSVDAADADASYSANEQALINELKADVNTLVTDLNTAITKLNALMANMRTANQIA
jgi:hypothetical protein